MSQFSNPIHTCADPTCPDVDLFGDPCIQRRKRRRCRCRRQEWCASSDGRVVLFDIRVSRAYQRWVVTVDVNVDGLTVHNVTCDGTGVAWPRYGTSPAFSFTCSHLRDKAEAEVRRVTRTIQRSKETHADDTD